MESFSPPRRNWYTRYKEPPEQEMWRVGSSDWVEFVRQSDKITPMIYRKLRDYVSEPLAEKRILDFGCGVGRVALQLHAKWGAPSHCRDVNKQAVKYLHRELPAVDCKVSRFKPPLDLESDTLDAVYSVSVWTHLPPDLQIPWLEEMSRILKPGGMALLTTSGALAVRMRQRRGVSGWDDVTPDDLRKHGMLYRNYGAPGTRSADPGIDGDYGLVAHDPAWIRSEWGKIMEVVAIHERVIDDIQDLVILRN